MALTCILRLAHSPESASVKRRSAPFDAEYAARLGLPRRPDVEATLMTLPCPCSRKIGPAARAQRYGREEINCEDVGPSGRLHLDKGAGRGYASIIDNHVEPAKGRHRQLDEVRNILDVRDIAHGGNYVIGKIFFEFCMHPHATGCRDYFHSLFRVRTSNRRSETLVCPGDDRNTILEFHVHVMESLFPVRGRYPVE